MAWNSYYNCKPRSFRLTTYVCSLSIVCPSKAVPHEDLHEGKKQGRESILLNIIRKQKSSPRNRTTHRSKEEKIHQKRMKKKTDGASQRTRLTQERALRCKGSMSGGLAMVVVELSSYGGNSSIPDVAKDDQNEFFKMLKVQWWVLMKKGSNLMLLRMIKMNSSKC